MHLQITAVGNQGINSLSLSVPLQMLAPTNKNNISVLQLMSRITDRIGRLILALVQQPSDYAFQCLFGVRPHFA